MIVKKTVFILGAGSSYPYDFPTGKELRKSICENFEKDYTKFMSEYNKRYSNDFHARKAKEFRDKFFNSSVWSIDKFLSLNPELLELGKMAIFFRIMEAEKNSKFREEVKDESNDWYSFLFNYLINTFTKRDQYHIAENNVTFITFNYDRSLEQFLFESFKNSYGDIGEKQLKEEFNKLKFIHVNGQISKLEWQISNNNFIPYRCNYLDIDIRKFTENIKVMYDERDNPEIEDAKKLISEAEQIFFLGFGYAKENLIILDLPRIFNKDQKVYGTILNLVQNEKNNIMGNFNRTDCPQITLMNMDCLMLLRNYL